MLNDKGWRAIGGEPAQDLQKRINPARLDALLQPAIQANHHTNFGPVSRQLESVLGDLNGANPARAACAVANANLELLRACGFALLAIVCICVVVLGIPAEG